MAKLPFSTRIRIFAKTGQWLREEKILESVRPELQRYGINLYSVVNKKTGKISYRITNLIESTSKVQCYEVSKIDQKFSSLDMSIIEIKGDGLYIFGNKGIFYKSLESKQIEEVFIPEDFIILSMEVKLNSKIVIIYGEKNDIIIKFDLGRVIQKIETNKILYVNDLKPIISKTNIYLISNQCDKNVLVVAEEDEYFVFYSINKDIVKEKIWIEDINELYKLMNQKLAKVYDVENGYYILISYEKQRNTITKWFAFDILKEIDKNYYFAFDKDSKFVSIIMKHSDSEKVSFSIIGKAPNGEYEHVQDIAGLKIFKMKEDDFVIVLILNGNKVNWKCYKAEDIKISLSDTLKDEKLVYIEPIIYPYKETLDN